MLQIIAIIFVILLILLLAIAATRPDTFRVERRISIKAPADKIFANINDFRSWAQWSPYDKLDPAMKKTQSGALQGTGAVYEWEGNAKAGAGRMEITQSSPPSKIVIQLDFSKPFQASNTAEFTLQSQGDTTDVTWAMYGASPYISKVMGLVFNMDTMIGKDFETGLANLKALVEK